MKKFRKNSNRYLCLWLYFHILWLCHVNTILSLCSQGGMCMAGGGIYHIHLWQGACVAGGHTQGDAWQERWPLLRMVPILLECILVIGTCKYNSNLNLSFQQFHSARILDNHLDNQLDNQLFYSFVFGVTPAQHQYISNWGRGDNSRSVHRKMVCF